MTALKQSCLPVLLVMALSACGEGGASRAADLAEQADAFLDDIHAGAWNAAYGRLWDGLQEECGSATGLKAAVEAAGARPAGWDLREPSVRKRSGIISGTVEKTGGGSGIVELSLDLIDGEWVITAWSADNRELCLESRR